MLAETTVGDEGMPKLNSRRGIRDRNCLGILLSKILDIVVESRLSNCIFFY